MLLKVRVPKTMAVYLGATYGLGNAASRAGHRLYPQTLVAHASAGSQTGEVTLTTLELYQSQTRLG